MKLFSNVVFFASVVTALHSGVINEGKTKIVRSYEADPSLAIFESKDDITAGDGAKHDVIKGKNELATETTCNVFRLLSDCGIPVAFRQQLDSKSFLGDLCEMIEYEVVVRREAHGSYLKRHPYLEKGHLFPQLIVEFFLKTSNRNWKGMSIPKDDPFIQFTREGAELFLPDRPISSQQPFMVLSDFPLKEQPALFEQIATIAKKTFLILEKAWQLENARLVDFKVEFGINSSGKLLLADVIDNDSWRVVQNQNYIDKQIYRDGGAIDKVAALYRHVSATTSHFRLPNQQVILWRSSESDDFEPLMKELEQFSNEHLKVTQVTCKNPLGTFLMVQEKVQQIPDSVLIATDPSFIVNQVVPLIAGGPGAAMSALQILAAHNPLLYMELRLKQEERLVDLLGLDE